MLAAAAALALALASSPAGAPQSPSAKPAAATRELTDEVGRAVRVPLEVRRVVSLAPSITETVFALGLDDRLVGVTDFCDWPPEAKNKQSVGEVRNPSLEQVVTLRPDVVLATKAVNRRETVEALERLGVAVYVTDPLTVEGVLASTARTAEVLGAPERGAALVASLRARLENLRRRLADRQPKRVLFVVWHEPLISTGRGTFLWDALRLAGAESVVDTEQDWPRLSLEEVARQQPDYLVFAGDHQMNLRRLIRSLGERPGWRSLDAVREDRVVVVSDALNRPAPRIVEAIEQLARALHAEAFAEAERGKGKREKGSSGVARYSPFRFSLFPFPFAPQASLVVQRHCS